MFRFSTIAANNANFDVDYELSGCVNNAPLDVKGKGKVDLNKGVYEMLLTMARVPMHWDPAFVILICCDRMLGVSAKEADPHAKNIFSMSHGDHILAWRQAGIYDSEGREVGYASASSYGYKEGNILRSRSQLLTGHIHLDISEQVTQIATPYTAMMMPFGANMSLLTSAYSFSTSAGNKYKGFTVYPYKFPNGNSVQHQQLLTVEDVQFKRNTNKSSGETTFHFQMTSKMESMAAFNQAKSDFGNAARLDAGTNFKPHVPKRGFSTSSLFTSPKTHLPAINKVNSIAKRQVLPIPVSSHHASLLSSSRMPMQRALKFQTPLPKIRIMF